MVLCKLLEATDISQLATRPTRQRQEEWINNDSIGRSRLDTGLLKRFLHVFDINKRTIPSGGFRA
jgi:hypothetical protein